MTRTVLILAAAIQAAHLADLAIRATLCHRHYRQHPDLATQILETIRNPTPTVIHHPETMATMNQST